MKVPALVCAWCGKPLSFLQVEEGHQRTGVCKICELNGLRHPNPVEVPRVPAAMGWFIFSAVVFLSFIAWFLFKKLT